MNPFITIIQEALRQKMILLMLGAATGVATDESLPFLANALTPKGKETVGKALINSARKDRVALERALDSINQVTNICPQETTNRKSNEEVNRNVDTLADVQLDSILTNYKYAPFTKR